MCFQVKLQSIFSLILCALFIGFCSSAASTDYPFMNPYQATIIGTPAKLQAKFPKDIPFEANSLDIFDNRHIPEALWYYKELHYSVVRQKTAAPLVFSIAGTGADHDSEKNIALLSSFYKAGFHAVGLTSPSHPNFITAASSTGVPGHLDYDAEDLYRVMQKIWDQLKDEIQVTEFYLIGYSLGGTQAAFVAKVDKEKNIFDFKKVLLVNPSLTLYNSVSKLDRMLENIPGGIDNFNQYFDRLVLKISEQYNRSDGVEFNEELIFKAFMEDLPRDEELAAIIGVAFRVSSANMILTSDIMTNFGFIKPSNEIFTKTTQLTKYLRACMRLGFTDYYHEYLFPYFKQRDPSLTRESLYEMLSLKRIEPFLRSETNIGVMHNEDDIILVEGEIDYFRELFGARATFSKGGGIRSQIHINGGHMGNLLHYKSIDYITEYFKK